MLGTPQVRREKAYAAETGYVYQYFYNGYREVKRGGSSGREYVFEVTSDRVSSILVNIFFGWPSIEAWQQAHVYEFSPTEQYAVVKMSLFKFFEEVTDFGDTKIDVVISIDDIENHAATLQLG